jgi:hypothetical protein
MQPTSARIVERSKTIRGSAEASQDPCTQWQRPERLPLIGQLELLTLRW